MTPQPTITQVQLEDYVAEACKFARRQAYEDAARIAERTDEDGDFFFGNEIAAAIRARALEEA
jgi:hypothetical protein